jgi:hypothetical protein
VSPKSGVLSSAAILCPITSVDGKLHQICETTYLASAFRFVAWQSPKFVKVNGFSSPRCQVRIDEIEMSEFIFSIVMDVLRHVKIEYRKRIGVGF